MNKLSQLVKAATENEARLQEAKDLLIQLTSMQQVTTVAMFYDAIRWSSHLQIPRKFSEKTLNGLCKLTREIMEYHTEEKKKYDVEFKKLEALLND